MIKLFLLLFINILLYSSDLNILNNQDKYSVIPTIKIYNNKNKDIDIKTISKDSINWIKDSNNKYLNFGYSNETHWIKFDLMNKSKKDFLMKFDLITINILNVYNFKNDKLISSYSTGIDKPFSTRPFNSNKFIIPLDLTINQTHTIYVEIKNNFKVNNISFNIISHEELHEETVSSNMFNGLILGILSIMFLYNMIIYMITKYKPYKFYLLYSLSLIIVNITFLGYGYMYLYPNYSLLNKILIAISGGLLPIFMILFIKNVLEVTVNSIENKILNICIVISSVFLLILLSSIYKHTEYIYLISKQSIVFFGITILILTILIIKEAIKKNKLAQFLFIAWIIPFIGLAVFIINNFYFILDTSTLHRFVQLTLIVELILMSLIIAYKMKEIENEKEELILKNQEKDLELLKQLKFASMGQLLQYITHQWKQPLMRINSTLLAIESKLSKEDIYLNKYFDLIEMQTNNMSKTISVFSQYFHPSKEKISFNLFRLLEETIEFYERSISPNKINFEIICENKSIESIGFYEESKQVLLILFNNANDEFENNALVERNIICTIGIYKNLPSLTIENNGPNIPSDIIEKVFDPYYTTKANANNEGIGLYIAKLLIEDSMNKKITIENTNTGVKFIIRGQK